MARYQRRAPAVTVKLNNVAINYLHPLEIGRSAMGKSLDYAEFELQNFPQQTKARYVFDIKLIDDLEQKRCQVYMTDEAGNNKMIHWGWIDSKTVQIDRSERQVVRSRVQPYHFGDPIRGMRVWNPFVSAAVDSLEQIVFNPQLDGRIANNQSNIFDDTGHYNLFLHPECQRSTNSIAANGATHVNGWSLLHACYYLCKSANGTETFISNPTFDELEAVLPGDETILRNHAQPFGEYLPAHLDALLEPYGYGWYVNLDDGFPKIAVFKRGVGEPVYGSLQPIGERIDLDFSNAEETGITTDVANQLANRIEIYGDTVMVEGTWELAPAWHPDYDSLPLDPTSADKLTLHGGTTNAWDSLPALARVWRDWILNEAGDYTGLRSDARLTKPYDFNAAAGIPGLCFMARRRRFLPCLSLGADGRPVGEHHGCVVEAYRYDRAPDSPVLLPTGTWQPIERLLDAHACSIQILDKECGIRFCGHDIPHDLVQYGAAGTRIRVTATVEMDARVAASLPAGALPSANAFGVFRVVDVGSRFKSRGVLALSKFFEAAPFASTAVDDRPKAQALAAELLANWNQASISGNVSLPLDWVNASICLGRPFSGIGGRNISFLTTRVNPQKYPSVTAIKYDFVNQKTLVTLDTWRRDRV